MYILILLYLHRISLQSLKNIAILAKQGTAVPFDIKIFLYKIYVHITNDSKHSSEQTNQGSHTKFHIYIYFSTPRMIFAFFDSPYSPGENINILLKISRRVLN